MQPAARSAIIAKNLPRTPPSRDAADDPLCLPVFLSPRTHTLTFLRAPTGRGSAGRTAPGVAEGELPTIDPKKPLWKVEIPGKGVSSPIVVGGKLFLQTASNDGKTRLAPVPRRHQRQDGLDEGRARRRGEDAREELARLQHARVRRQQIYCEWWDGTGVASTPTT